MKNALVLTIIGPDHSGIIDDLSTVIAQNEGNWLESRMCNLAGQFAGVLLIECPPGNCERMKIALETLDSGGLDIQVTAGHEHSASTNRDNIKLEIAGPDHPGIVQDISHFLADKKINIVEMTSHYEEGAMSGGYIFYSTIVATIPQTLNFDDVEDALDVLSDALNVDITLDNLKGLRTRI